MKKRHYKIGSERNTMPLPATIDECISTDNIVRAIDVYVDTLDLDKFSFKNAGGELTVGQPSFSPADLLKLYLWGCQNRIHSSRCLEKETYRNLEVIWLIKNLHPCYKTIADFRKDNIKAIKAVRKDFISLCKELNLLDGKLVSIDSAFFEGNASKRSVHTKSAVEKRLKTLETKIKICKEDQKKTIKDEEKIALDNKLNHLQEQQKEYQKYDEQMKANNAIQICTTDADARKLIKKTDKGPTIGFNVQCGVDSKHNLIVASEVTNALTDHQQLASISIKAKEALGVDELKVAADAGYYKQEEIKKCIDAHITPYVAIPDRNKPLRDAGRFDRSFFNYDIETNTYVCPAEKMMHYQSSFDKNGKTMLRYVSKAKQCRQCRLKEKCLPKKTPYRQICRWEHEVVVEEHQQRMDLEGKEYMKKRAASAEHPFGTLKLWRGWTHFLLRGLEKVNAEKDLLVTSYNFLRVINIIGIKAFLDYCNQRVKTALNVSNESIFVLFSLLLAAFVPINQILPKRIACFSSSNFVTEKTRRIVFLLQF